MSEGGDGIDSPSVSVSENSRTLRVLCVDDDASFVELAGMQLERLTADSERPFSVVTETDPTAALSYLDGIDCVVSDYDMPEVDGLELLETLREHDPDVPFILFTGRGSEQIASRAISAGVTDYIRKGGQSDRFVMLANRIDEAVARYEAEREVERSTDRLRRVIDLLPHCLFVKDGDGRYLLINESGAASYGLPPTAVEGRYESEFLDDDTAARFNAEDRGVIDTGEPIEITDQRVVDASGDEYVERVRKVPFDYAVGENQAVLGIATDVTTEHRLSERCAALHDVVDALDTTLDETRTAYENGNDGAVADGHDRIADYLDRLRRLMPEDEIDRLLADPPDRLTARPDSDD